MDGKLEDMAKKRYTRAVLSAIQKERRAGRRKRFVSAAACLVALTAATVLFQNEVHAAIARISYSLSAALGLESDLAEYKEVVNTSVTDKGYVVTLQEAVVAPEKLVVSYTVQREDGEPLDESFMLSGTLYVNGRAMHGGSSGSSGFIDEGRTILGTEMAYDMYDVDDTAENVYELKLTELHEVFGSGKWDFKFRASGQEMAADTKRLALNAEYAMPDGSVLILDELTFNDLEQRISFHISERKTENYLLKLLAEDDQGRKVEFYTSRFGKGEGYMLNAEVLEDSRIAEDAKTVEVTLYAVEIPETSGRMPDDYVQIGETAVWELDWTE